MISIWESAVSATEKTFEKKIFETKKFISILPNTIFLLIPLKSKIFLYEMKLLWALLIIIIRKGPGMIFSETELFIITQDSKRKSTTAPIRKPHIMVLMEMILFILLKKRTEEFSVIILLLGHFETNLIIPLTTTDQTHLG